MSFIKSTPFYILFFLLFIISCDSSKLNETPLEKFEGIWMIEGRPMLDGIKIKIEKDSSNSLVGKIIEINDNKYVKMFVELNDVWVTKIKRSSNYKFELKENKIGSDLFSLYGLSTTIDFNAQFIDENTVGLIEGNGDASKSDIKYSRVTDFKN